MHSTADSFTDEVI